MNGGVKSAATQPAAQSQPSCVAKERRKMMISLEDIDVSGVLGAWTHDQESLSACFWRYDEKGRRTPADEHGGEDFETVRKKTTSRDAVKRTLVVLSYENPKGAAGGINAVVSRMPAEMSAVLKAPRDKKFDPEILRISPLHTGLRSKYEPGDLIPAGSCVVPFGKEPVNVEIFRVTVDGQVWHVFRANGFFEADGGVGRTDPYTYGWEGKSQRDGEESCLLRDSLFASRAVPEILEALDKTKDLVVHAQDWEFACAVLTVKEQILSGKLESAAVVLTLHNPYDHNLSEVSLSQISDRHHSWQWPEISGQGRPTVLTRMVPLMDAPISVVSHQFAKDLTNHPQQRGVFTGHQQKVLGIQRLVGIDNGNFVKPGKENHFTLEAVAKAKDGDCTLILNEKLERRQKMLRSLDTYVAEWLRLPFDDLNRIDRPIYGRLFGGMNKEPLADLPPDVPIFMMVGRLDPGQKGYDLVARLIESVPRGWGRFVLTPMSPLAEDPDVSPFMRELQNLAEKERPGEVVVFAHRMTGTTYGETMSGCTYGLWPSIYEPFGGANEFYAAGSPVIAFATGGLVQQVIDYDRHPQPATGFLYSEYLSAVVSSKDLEEQFRRAHEALPEDRLSVPAYRGRFSSLAVATAEAVALYKHKRAAYGRMLANLREMYEDLDWQKPVSDYLEWYDHACG